MLVNLCVVLLFACAAMLHHPMVSIIINGIILVTLSSGLLFFLGTCVGIIRFPDFYTRLHAAGKGDTLSTILILFACALYAIQSAHHLDQTSVLSAVKILLIINFIFIGSPTATHALIEAGENSEVKPWKRDS